MTYAWIVVLVAAVIIEALTAELMVIWFFPAALVSLVLSFFPVPWPVQVLVFLLVGTALLIATRPLCRRFIEGRKVKTNSRANIGKTCYVTEEINNLAEQGEVKLGGLAWSARSESGATIAVGTLVEVLEIRGVKLIVRVANEQK